MSTANIIGNAIFGLRNKSGGNYIDPSVKESLVGLWKFDQNTNESPTRNIIKNTIKDKGGDLELLNFGYKLNSGYGGYIEDFSLFILSNRFEYSEISNTKVTITAVLDNRTGIYHSVTEEESALYWNTFKIKVSGSTDDVYISYTTAKKSIRLYNGINTVVVPNELSWHSFSASKANTSCNITLEFVPLYEGALVTDGKDDMIVSQKTVQEMLGGSKKITVVSMINHINNNVYHTNYIRSKTRLLKNYLFEKSYSKSFIYGYTATNVGVTGTPSGNLTDVILGDKEDLYTIANNYTGIDSDSRFSIEGYINSNNGVLYELSEVAVYWTFIANKVLTTDEINQIIAYFKLDKYVTPQVIYDVKKQGLSNDTPEADWYLKDFSGNGHDMTLYNFAKKLGSGIGKYEVDFNTWIPQSYVADSAYTSNKLHITNIKGGNAILYTKKGANAMKVKITGIQSFNLVYRYIAENDVWEALEVDRDGIYELPASTTTTKTYYTGFTVPYYTGDCDITIEQIPDYEGALVSDGIDDYGKVENLPIYKDYTVVADREIVDGLIDNAGGGVAIRSYNYAKGAFGFDWKNQAFSFGGNTDRIIDVQRFISYQSKYINNGIQLITGNVVDNNPLYMARLGEENRYSKLALWSFLLFPYSLSEFLLERQLKRYKLGTLYPGMIEWRPKVNINVPVVTPPTFSMNNGSDIITNGQYIPEGTEITIRIFTTTDSSVGGINEVTAKINGVDIELSPSGNKTYYGGKFIVSSKQKIAITIDEYIRYEDIVQPYPAIINLKQDGKTITWGDKLKVGSDIVFVGSANLLPELYTVSDTRYNGVTLYPNTIIKVEKSMVFDNARTYLKANEPSCILSPNRLRIPNSSYKILGYIPDLTGKGNHGRLNNFVYAGMSGANGYVEDFTKWSKNSSLDDIEITYDRIKVNKLTGSTVLYVTSNKFINKIKIVASGIPNRGKLTFTQYPDNAIENNKEFEIGGVTTTGSWGFSIKEGLNLDWSNLVIQQIGEHEGSICFDGTDDHITIPTLAHGGKQVLMKVNLQSYNRYLYDQRNNWNPYLAIVSAGKTIAYEYSNKGGKTYIDGILNEHIIDNDLLNITHNITATNANIGVQYAPNIGTSFARGNFAQMALFDFMLFSDISSEEEIKELNDIVGIEGGYVESPDYYWDAYGKKNTDTDRNLIADQVSKDVANALEVKNVAYNSESGYTDDNGLLLDGVEDHAVNTVIPAVTDFTVIAKREFPESALANNQTFLIKGDAINGNNNVNSLLMECYYGAQNYIISFSHQQIVPLEESKISWITPTSYNGNALTKGSGVDSVGLTIGRYKDLYRKAVFYKLMFYTKTIDQLSINMLKNLFERDELIDVTNPIFKKEELTKIGF